MKRPTIYLRRLVFSIAGVVLLVSPNPSFATSSHLYDAPFHTHDTGRSSSGIAIGDVNGDGLPDVVTVNEVEASITVLPGLGGRDFGAPIHYAFPPSPSAVELFDLDHDGALDVVVSSAEGISIDFGNGDGSFGNRVHLDTGHYASTIEAGDVDRDGHVDLVAGRALIRGAGGRSFHPSSALGEARSYFVLEDLDRDGDLDLVVSRTGIESYLGRGDGTFEFERRSGGLMTWHIAAGVSTEGRRLEVVALMGFGVDFAVDGVQGNISEINPAGLAVGDLNEDGWLDFVVGHEGSSYGVSVVVSDGLGGFEPRWRVPVHGWSRWVALGDLDQDGHIDLVATDRHGTVTVAYGRGDGTFYERYGVLGGPSSVALEDVDNDGRLDMIAGVGYGNSMVTVLRGLGDGTFETWRSSGPSFIPGVGMRTGDLDSDGHVDVLFPVKDEGVVALFKGLPDGLFEPRVDLPVQANPHSIAISDLDDDGIADLAVANRDAGTVSLLIGNGDGTFEPARHVACGVDPIVVDAGDLNGDGVVDLALTRHAADSVTVLLGAGGGDFGPRLNVSTPGDVTDVEIVEKGGDRPAFLAFTSGTEAQVFPHGWFSVSPWLPTGLGDRVDYRVSRKPYGVEMSDMNDDGRLDAVVAGLEHTLEVFFGVGDAVFSPGAAIGGFGQWGLMDVADLNGDGLPDLALANPGYPADVVVMLNQGPAPQVSVSRFDVEVEGTRARVRWQPEVVGSFARTRLESSESPDGPWRIEGGKRRHEGDQFIAFDGTPNAYYRLIAVTTDHRLGVFGPIAAVGETEEPAAPVEPPSSGVTTIGISPNPSKGVVRVGFSMPKAGYASVDVVDIQGRVIARLADGHHAPGAHAALWNGTTARGRAPAGLYFVRIKSPGATAVRRLVLSR